MCVHCENAYGKDIEIKASPNDKLTQPNKAQITQLKGDSPGIVLYRYGLAQGYFEIKYCPFCGENLKENPCKDCANYNIGDGIDDIRNCYGCKFS